MTINLPNFITFGRILSVPVIFWLLISDQGQLAFFVFLVAGISDAVDGYLAKTFGWQTELGAYLDPIADKLLLVSIFIALGVKAELPLWLVIAVVSRDVLIVMGVMLAWLLGQPITVRPLVISKWNTAAQITLAAFVLAEIAFRFGAANIKWVLIWATALLTVLSLAAYTRAWFRHMNGEAAETNKTDP